MPSNRPHIIQRQVLDIRLPERDNAFEIQNRVSSLYQDRIARELDDVFTRMSSPDEYFQIGKLEIDLGVVSLTHLDKEFGRRVRERVTGALSERLHHLGRDRGIQSGPIMKGASGEAVEKDRSSASSFSSPENVANEPLRGLGRVRGIQTGPIKEGASGEAVENGGSSASSFSPGEDRMISSDEFELELIRHFLKTGALPWWTETPSPGMLEEILSDRIKEKPDETRILFEKEIRNATFRRRLVRQFPEPLILEVIELLTPGKKRTIRGWLEDVDEALRSARIPLAPGVNFRQIVLDVALDVAPIRGSREFEEDELLKTIVEAMASRGDGSHRGTPASAQNAVEFTKKAHRRITHALLERLNGRGRDRGIQTGPRKEGASGSADGPDSPAPLPVSAEDGIPTSGEFKLETIRCFLKTRASPRRTETPSPGPLDEILADLIKEKPHETRILFEKEIRAPTIRRRLIQQFPEPLILEIIELLAPGKTGAIRGWLSDLTETLSPARTTSDPGMDIRQIVLDAALAVSPTRDSPGFEEGELLKIIIGDMADQGDHTHRDVLLTMQSAMERLATRGFTFKSPLPRLMKSPLSELARTDPPSGRPPDSRGGSAARDQDQPHARTPPASRPAPGAPRAETTPAPRHGRERTTGSRTSFIDEMGEAQSESRDAASAKTGKTPFQKRGRTPVEDRPRIQERTAVYGKDARVDPMQGQAAPGGPGPVDGSEKAAGPDARITRARKPSDPGRPKAEPATLPARGRQSTAEALPLREAYIENAGLILVWPFLKPFFSQFSLLAPGEDRFVDDAATERAMRLLQHLATGEQGAPEYTLPLNKLLCGWDLEKPVDRFIDLTETEKKESEKLLEAIIAHWKTLKNTSVRGFRESFLKRNGILEENEDKWLLRVERKAHDMLLERLPWGISIIKLSWMENPLYVEW